MVQPLHINAPHLARLTCRGVPLSIASSSRSIRSVQQHSITDTSPILESAILKLKHRKIPPPPQREMKVLDRSKFTRDIPCLAVRVDPDQVDKLMKDKAVQKQLLAVPKIPRICPDPEDKSKRFLLFDAQSENDLQEPVRQKLEPVWRGCRPWTVTMNYDHWMASDILEAVLPENLVAEAPSAFTSTGHIGHLNLRDEYLPYKYVIGQVILDKNKSLRTVVNKIDTIDTEFRVFKMEVLAGDPELVTTAHEAGCSFRLDFSAVYWNSRLSHEHERLVADYFKPGQVVADVMAGVGPFAIPAAKKRCYVMGNDLNPESAKWMEVNRVENKVEDALRVSNIDGREFIRTAATSLWRQPFALLRPSVAEQRKLDKQRRKAREAAAKKADASAPTSRSENALPDAVASRLKAMDLSSSPSDTPKDRDLSSAATSSPPKPTSPRTISHFVMNLPGSALEFLDAYRGCYVALKDEPDFPSAEVDAESMEMPLIHTHCFTKCVEPEGAEKDICERASHYLSHRVHPGMDGYYLHFVRGVAPNKDMYCLTFRLPREVAWATGPVPDISA